MCMRGGWEWQVSVSWAADRTDCGLGEDLELFTDSLPLSPSLEGLICEESSIKIFTRNKNPAVEDCTRIK